VTALPHFKLALRLWPSEREDSELAWLLLDFGAAKYHSADYLTDAPLLEVDREILLSVGLMLVAIAIVLATPALPKSLAAEGIADNEISPLLATDRVIPVAHGTTFDALWDVSPGRQSKRPTISPDVAIRGGRYTFIGGAAGRDKFA